MTIAPVTFAAGDVEYADRRPVRLWQTLVGTLEGRVGLGLALAMLLLIVLGPALAPYAPDQIGVGLPEAGPSTAHWLGTDQLGRDVFSRFLGGGRTVILVPLAANLVAFALGGGLGMLGAYRRGVLDSVITRVFDLFLALPSILIALVFIAEFGTSWTVLVLTVGLVWSPRVGRIIRGAAQQTVTSDYISAAQARGERTAWILVREIFPNAAGPILATFALYLTYGVIFVATLSFLGLGAQPPSSDWGLMVSDSRTFIVIDPWATIAPALGIAALSVAGSLIADAVTRHLSREIEQSPAPV